MDYDPPFMKTYSTLLQDSSLLSDSRNYKFCEYCEFPLIDLGRLNLEREKCVREIREAARKWGFFQVVNHGVPQELLENLMCEQMIKMFHRPFATKSQENFKSNMSASGSSGYRWGNPSAMNPSQLSWSEAFHVFLPDIATMDNRTNLRSRLEYFAERVGCLAERLAEILAEEGNIKCRYFRENCLPNTCFLRLNRYPTCPNPTIASKVFGILPHTDSSFLTIVYQDQVGGLQLMKDGMWVAVKPNPHALLVNIGDLFQAVSNGLYKSIKHRVVATEKVERYSVAYFYSPSYDTVIERHGDDADIGTPSLYRKFTFREYKDQTEKDVNQTGDKVGLSRFLL